VYSEYGDTGTETWGSVTSQSVNNTTSAPIVNCQQITECQ